MEGAAAQRERCDCRSNYRRVVISGFGAAAVELPSFFLLLFSNQISFVAPLFLFSFFFCVSKYRVGNGTKTGSETRPAPRYRVFFSFFFPFFVFILQMAFVPARTRRLATSFYRVCTEFSWLHRVSIGCSRPCVFFFTKKMFIHHRMIK